MSEVGVDFGALNDPNPEPRTEDLKKYEKLITYTDMSHKTAAKRSHMSEGMYEWLFVPGQHGHRWYHQMLHGHSCWPWHVRSCVLPCVHCDGNW